MRILHTHLFLGLFGVCALGFHGLAESCSPGSVTSATLRATTGGNPTLEPVNPSSSGCDDEQIPNPNPMGFVTKSACHDAANDDDPCIGCTLAPVPNFELGPGTEPPGWDSSLEDCGFVELGTCSYNFFFMIGECVSMVTVTHCKGMPFAFGQAGP